MAARKPAREMKRKNENIETRVNKREERSTRGNESASQKTVTKDNRKIKGEKRK